MLPFITIRQDVLAHWPGIDFNDGAIVALVVSMDPRNPRVRALPSGETLCTTRYIEEMLPMIGCGPERIRKRVQKLVRVGVLDTALVRNTLTGHRLRYLKPSRFYYAEVRRIEKRADRSRPDRKSSPRAREYGVENDPLLMESKTTPDHLYDQRKGRRSSRSFPPSPPSLIAAGGAGSRAAGGQEPKKIVPPRCPSCGEVVQYLDWPSCHHCSNTWPGGVSGAEYFAGIPGAVP